MIPTVAIFVALLQSQASNAELGYRFALPAGFEPFAEARASSPDLVDCWREATPVSTQGALVLCVQRMHGELGREAMRPEQVPATAQSVSFRWKDFDIQGLRSLVSQDGKQVFVLVTQVPLRHEAVQLTLAGPADQEARGRTLMAATLASLAGDTNWLTGRERSERLGRAAGPWIGIALAVIAVVWWRKRRAAA